MKRHLPAVLAAAVLVLGPAFVPVATAAPVEAPALARSDEPGPMYGAPAPTDCFNAPRYSDIAGETLDKPAVPCTEKHTVWMLAVGELPKGVDVSSDKAWDAAKSVCTTKVYASAIGSYRTPTMAKSAYLALVFRPTKAQIKNGARWVSCGVTLYEGTKLHASTDVTPPKLTRNPPAELRLCLNAKRQFTNCASSSRGVSTHAVRLKYRGQDHASKTGIRICSARAGGRPFTYRTRFYDKRDYILVCFAKKG